MPATNPLLSGATTDTIASAHIQAVTNTVNAHVDSLTNVLTNREAISTLTPGNVVRSLADFDWSGVVTSLSTQIISIALRILAAIAIFYIGRFIINKIHKVARAIMVSRSFDRSLTSFLLSLIKVTLLFVLVVTVIGVMGIETSSFIAIFASAGVAIGMALSGTLQNFAGGVLLLLLKPYKAGDLIEFGTYKGYVKEIQIFHTVITTLSNDRIVIPNGGLSTGTINNISGEAYHRLQWNVSLSYGDDVSLARRVLLELLASDERIIAVAPPDPEADTVSQLSASESGNKKKLPRWLSPVRWLHGRRNAADGHDSAPATAVALPSKDFTPQVLVDRLADSSVELLVRAWCATADYWAVYYSMNERIYTELPRRGLHFPFPQLDVHFDSASAPTGEQ